MKRILMMVLRNIFRVPFMWIKLCYMAAHADKYTDEQHAYTYRGASGDMITTDNLDIARYAAVGEIQTKNGVLFCKRCGKTFKYAYSWYNKNKICRNEYIIFNVFTLWRCGG